MWALKQNAVIFCFDFGVPFVSKPMLQQSLQLQLFGVTQQLCSG